nr:hypothetical protein [Tanacetum cinerariifolium]
MGFSGSGVEAEEEVSSKRRFTEMSQPSHSIDLHDVRQLSSKLKAKLMDTVVAETDDEIDSVVVGMSGFVLEACVGAMEGGNLKGDKNPICTLKDYSKPSHEGYRNTIELPVGNNVVPLRSDTIWLVQNGCSFHGLRSKDFAKPVKAIALPQDVPSTSDRRLIKLENRVQHLMEAYLALTRPTHYCVKDPKQAFIEYTSSRTNEAGDARLSKFEADFKQQQSEMTNKIDVVLKAITDPIAGTLPSDTVKNPKLSTYLVLFARSYLTKDPQCSTIVHGSINAITVCLKQPTKPQTDESEEKEHGKEGNPEDTNTMVHNEKQRDTSQLEPKGTSIDNLRPNRNDDAIEWLDVKEPLDLVDIS